jgi:predicted NACHT family NTPase
LRRGSLFKDNSVLTFEPIHETELQDAKDLESGEEVERIVRNPSKESFSNLRIQDALKRNQRLVILGDPGSGKTTFTKWLTLHMAENHLGKKSNSKTYLNDDILELIPVPVTLRYFADYISKNEVAFDLGQPLKFCMQPVQYYPTGSESD